MSEQTPDPDRPDDEDTPDPHDPTGLDLAHAVASDLRVPTAGSGRKGASGASRARRKPRAEQGSRDDDRDPALLGEALERLVRESGWTIETSVHSVLGRWAQIVGTEVARHCRPVGYTDGVVAVEADSTAWATQLRLLAPTIVARLNAELGDGTVARIEVNGPAAPSWKRGPRSVRDGRGPRDTYG